MKKIFDIFLKYSWLLIILYSSYGTYTYFLENEEKYKSFLDDKQIKEQATRALKQKNKKALEYSKNIQNAQGRIDEIKKHIDEVQRQLPNVVSDTEVLDLFSREANGLNIKDVKLQPLLEYEKDFYFSKQFNLKADGTFLQFLIFFEKIYNQERIYNVQSLNIKKSNMKSRGRFQLLSMETVIESFRYNPEKSKKMIDDAEESAKNEAEARKKEKNKNEDGSGNSSSVARGSSNE